jgi:preprotein translocase subunit YajC
LLAQATQSGAAGPTTSAPPNGIEYFFFKSGSMPLLIAMLAVMYFFIFRSKKTKDKQRTSMLEQLKRGDEIQTIGGIIGTVVEARETEVIVKVDETTNAKMKFSRNAIHRVLEPKNKDKDSK